MIRLVCGAIFFSLLGLVLQGVVLHALLPAYLIPNFLLILVVFLGFYEISVAGVVLSFSIGLLFDLFSGTLLGPWSGAFVLVYVLLAIFAQRLFTRSAATILLSVFLANNLCTAVYFALLYQFQPIRGQLFSISVVEALSSSVVAPFVFALLTRILLPEVSARSSRQIIPHAFSMARSER